MLSYFIVDLKIYQKHMTKEINIMEMLKAGVHFGHKKSKLNPKMKMAAL